MENKSKKELQWEKEFKPIQDFIDSETKKLIEPDSEKKATKKLLKIIGDNYGKVKYLIIEYKLDSGNNPLKRPKRTYERLSEYKKRYPETELRNITKILQKLRKDDWLSKKDVDNIRDYLVKQISLSGAYAKSQAAIQLKKTLKTGGRSPKDHYLDFLVVSLIDLVKKCTGSPHYQLVADFLSEQDIIIPKDEDTFKKYYQRVSRRFPQTLRLLKEEVEAVNSLVTSHLNSCKSKH